MRNNCADYLRNECEGKIRVNENNRIIDVLTGMKFPLMIGKGGMRRILEMRAAPKAAQAFVPSQVNCARSSAVNVGNIMLEMAPSYASVGGGSVIVSTIDFENDTHSDEIVDVDVFEKRRCGGLGSSLANKRARLSKDSATLSGASQQSHQCYVEDFDDEEDLPVRPFHRPLPPASSAPIPLLSSLPQFRSQGPVPFAPVPAVPLAPPVQPAEDHVKKFRLAS